MTRDLKHLVRQFDLIPESVHSTPITIIGAGAIGSEVTVKLAKMGFHNITVFDDDEVDVVNLNSQFYRFKDIGKLKVEALAEIVMDFANVEIVSIPLRFTQSILPVDGIVICAVDSMEARKMIFDMHKGRHGTELVIDSRMGAEQFLFYSYRPGKASECEGYAKTLYSDADSVPTPCTAKATTYCVSQISALVCGTVKQFTTRQSYVHASSGSVPMGEVTAYLRKQ